MSFMQREITGQQEWLEIEADGTWFIPSEDAPEVLAVLCLFS